MSELFDQDDEYDFAVTRAKRHAVVEKITSNSDVYQDPKMLAVLLKALDGLDSSAIKRANAKSAERAASAEESKAASVAALLRARHQLRTEELRRTEDPELSAENSVVQDVVPGETDIGTVSISTKLIAEG